MNATIKLNQKLNELKEPDINLRLEIIDSIQSDIEKINADKITPIYDLIDINITELNIPKLNSIIGILFMNYQFDGKIENEISLKLIEVLYFITDNFPKLLNQNADFTLYLIFDTYFHNYGLIEEMNKVNRKRLINVITKIAKIKYTKAESKDSGFTLALQKIIKICFYFGNTEGREILNNYFLNHFDELIVDCAKDEMEINCA